MVRENAHLVIRDANLIVEQSYDDEFRIAVFENGVLELINARVSAEGGVHVVASGRRPSVLERHLR